MKTSELIELLKQCEPDTIVMVRSDRPGKSECFATVRAIESRDLRISAIRDEKKRFTVIIH